MRKSLLSVLFAIALTPVFSQTVHNGSLASTDSTFVRPDEGAPPTTLSLTETHVFYDTIMINVPVASLITFSASSIWDNFMILYSPAGFNHLAPLENALVADDDFVGPDAGFTYVFNTPGVYTLVICSYKNDVRGTYTVTSSVPVPLPLKLLSFTAIKSGNSNIVRWSTAEESNLTAYQVQFSANNNDFTDLKNGWVAAKNSATTSSYSFTHNDAAQGYNYYRLKITERSGHISYSPVALVKNIKPGLVNVHLYPNPSADYLKIESKSMQNVKAFISVVNSMGQTMQSGQYNFDPQGTISLDVKKLPAGKYFIKTIVADDATMMSFIKN